MPRHTAAPAIEFPDNDRFELAEPGVAKELVEPRAAGRGPAEARIYVLLKDFPSTLGDVLPQFVEPRFATLVRSADSGANGDDHGLQLHERS